MAVNKLKSVLAGTILGYAFSTLSAGATEISTNIARMQAMDKITGTVRVIDLPVNSEVKYGSFSIVVRSCKTRPPEETPENFAFVDIIDDYKSANPVNIFRGWMVSSSPSLNPVEHPIYDIWLLNCENGKVDPRLKIMTPEELKARNQIPQAEQKDGTANPDVENIPGHILKGEAASVAVSDESGVRAETAENDAAPKAAADKVIAPEPKVGVVAADEVQDGTPRSLVNINEDAAVEPSVQEKEPDLDISSDVSQAQEAPARQSSEEAVVLRPEASEAAGTPESVAPADSEGLSLLTPEAEDELPPVEEIEENGMLDDQLIDFSE